MGIDILNLVDDRYLVDITGGSAISTVCIFAGVVLFVSFCIGAIDGYLNPNTCNYEGDS